MFADAIDGVVANDLETTFSIIPPEPATLFGSVGNSFSIKLNGFSPPEVCPELDKLAPELAGVDPDEVDVFDGVL